MPLSDEDQTRVYRGTIATFACAIYNDEDLGKEGVIDLLRMEERPDELTDEVVLAAIDRIFERAGS